MTNDTDLPQLHAVQRATPEDSTDPELETDTNQPDMIRVPGFLDRFDAMVSG